MKNKTIGIFVLAAMILFANFYLASALTINSVTAMPDQAQPGQTVSLSLNIKNDLGQDADNIVVSLVLNDPTNPVPFAPYQSSNSARIESISDGESKKANFNLLASSNAASGTYKIAVQATYVLENGTPASENLGLISITVNAKPQISISAIDPALIKGQTGKLTLQITNSGLGDSKLLSISLSQVNGIQITSSGNVYIGNIDSNDFDTSDFNVYISQNAPSVINLPVEITYMDSGNNQITSYATVPLTVYTAQEAKNLGLVKGGSTFAIIILLIAAAVVFFIVRALRKRAKNKKRNGQ